MPIVFEGLTPGHKIILDLFPGRVRQPHQRPAQRVHLQPVDADVIVVAVDVSTSLGHPSVHDGLAQEVATVASGE